MKIRISLLILSILFSSCSSDPSDEVGKIRISSDYHGANIYIDGNLKGTIGDKGYTDISFNQGKHEIKVEKITDDWIYRKTSVVVIESNSSIKIKLDRFIGPKQAQRILAEKNKKQAQIIVARHQKNTARYISHDNGTVSDKNTGLMWKKCSEGQKWTSGHCSGKAGKYKWQLAQDNAKSVNYAGYSDWRVPTNKELRSLVFCSNSDDHSQSCSGDYQKPTINQNVFPKTPASYFWSSSVNAENSSSAWNIYFYYGNNYSKGVNYNLHMRLVRSGQ